VRQRSAHHLDCSPVDPRSMHQESTCIVTRHLYMCTAIQSKFLHKIDANYRHLQILALRLESLNQINSFVKVFVNCAIFYKSGQSPQWIFLEKEVA
jgi:hypothetical protein